MIITENIYGRGGAGVTSRRELHVPLYTVLEGRTGGSLARFTDEKNDESQITDIEISFSQITKISTLLSCSYATNSV